MRATVRIVFRASDQDGCSSLCDFLFRVLDLCDQQPQVTGGLVETRNSLFVAALAIGSVKQCSANMGEHRLRRFYQLVGLFVHVWFSSTLASLFVLRVRVHWWQNTEAVPLCQ